MTINRTEQALMSSLIYVFAAERLTKSGFILCCGHICPGMRLIAVRGPEIHDPAGWLTASIAPPLLFTVCSALKVPPHSLCSL